MFGWVGIREIFILLLFLLFCPIISAVIASSKNRNAVAWFFAGMFLGPIAILLVLLSPKLEKEVRAIIAQQSQQQQMMGPTIVVGGEKEYGNIDIESNPDKAEVEIDGSFIGTSPLVGIKLNAGEHLIKIVKKGYKAWERQLKVIAYSKIPIKIDLEKLDS